VRSASKLSVVAGFAALVVLSGCSSSTDGQAAPTTESESQTSEAPTDETTSEQEEPDYSLARLCELLSPEEAQRLGGSPEGEKGNAINDGHEICTWADQTGLVVGFQDGTSTAQAPTGPSITNTPTKSDGLPAVQSLETDPVVICQVMVDLPSGKMFTSSARVRSAGEGKYDPCQVATELSNLIIPRVKDQ
jgi:hypothetical protein